MKVGLVSADKYPATGWDWGRGLQEVDFVVKYKRCWWGVEMSQDDFGRWHGRSRTIQPNEWLVFCGNDDGTPCDIESNQYLGEKIFNASTQGALYASRLAW